MSGKPRKGQKKVNTEELKKGDVLVQKNDKVMVLQ